MEEEQKVAHKKLLDYLKSPEGDKKISEWVVKYARGLDHRDRWVEKFKTHCEADLAGSMRKLIDKYYSEEYRNREYKLNREPREPLLWLAYEYAAKYCKPYRGKKYLNMFTADAYHIGPYIIQLMIGQGSVLRIDKK